MSEDPFWRLCLKLAEYFEMGAPTAAMTHSSQLRMAEAEYDGVISLNLITQNSYISDGGKWKEQVEC